MFCMKYTVLSSTNISGTGWQIFDIKPYIMDWVNGVHDENYGILLDLENPYMKPDGLWGYQRYSSKEGLDSLLHPFIQLTYNIEGNLLTDDIELPAADTYIWERFPDLNFGNNLYYFNA